MPTPHPTPTEKGPIRLLRRRIELDTRTLGIGSHLPL
jgi:hypothetical protein